MGGGSSSSHLNSASASLRGTACGFEPMYENLDDLKTRGQHGVKFHTVRIYKEPFNLDFAGCVKVDHHAITYLWQNDDRKQRALTLDWCKKGLQSQQRMPMGGLVALEKSGLQLDPDKVRKRLEKIQDRGYDLISWNCRHLCKYMFRGATADGRVSAGEVAKLSHDLRISGRHDAHQKLS
ncbi:unnamed protein product [Polarella glacialis]|uniref:LRAT domain-containing protein n=1 Tax=Polarella glacialis TaxID=89957 RepID=A0A813H3G8_POLGL|nr:unnamed protein product [Polarella glacialis]